MVAVGTHLGSYEIVGVIGSGGMGEVYRARDPRLDREVAIKVLPQRLIKDEDAKGRFFREAKALAALSHSHILAIHEFSEAEGVPFLVMELLEGETLRHRLAYSSLSWQKAVEIGVALADGLSAAHARGILHRDLKPENVFLTADGGVKILDFGLARLEQQAPATTDAETLSLHTQEGTVLGTFPYMSPEQVLGGALDARSDIFSLGAILYEMVTGHGPFSRATLVDTKVAILKEEPPGLSDSGKKAPAELDRLIRHCLEKKPEERFHSARDLMFDLKAIQNGSGVESRLPASKPNARGRALGIAFALVVATLLLLAAWNPFQRDDGAIKSIVVLPFVNEGSEQTEYLSDGISESIINDLSRLPDLHVIARSSAFRYKGENDPLKAGRELGVDVVLAGRVMQRGDRLVVSFELADVNSQRQLFGERYDRSLKDILVLQDEISREICSRLRPQLSGEEHQRLANRQTHNTDAYQEYLVGRHHWNRRNKEGLEKAIEHFEMARSKDPAYALSYAGLADCYAMLADYGHLPPDEGFPKAKTMAEKALELDPSLAEARTSLAFVRMNWDWDWPQAEDDFRRALLLNPNYATAHQWYSEFLTAMGRHEEALAEIRRAQELDPLSLIITTVHGRALYFARRTDDAIAHCQKTLALDRNFAVAHMILGRAYVQKGEFDDALAAFETARRLFKSDAILAEVADAHARAGRRDEAQRMLQELSDPQTRGFFVDSPRLAMIHGALGQPDQAFALLEQALDERSSALVYLKVEPRFDNLRSDPRYAQFLRRIGLIK